jgi:hypothetical protein
MLPIQYHGVQVSGLAPVSLPGPQTLRTRPSLLFKTQWHLAMASLASQTATRIQTTLPDCVGPSYCSSGRSFHSIYGERVALTTGHHRRERCHPFWDGGTYSQPWTSWLTQSLWWLVVGRQGRRDATHRPYLRLLRFSELAELAGVKCLPYEASSGFDVPTKGQLFATTASRRIVASLPLHLSPRRKAKLAKGLTSARAREIVRSSKLPAQSIFDKWCAGHDYYN